jgi:hypothetical protein
MTAVKYTYYLHLLDLGCHNNIYFDNKVNLEMAVNGVGLSLGTHIFVINKWRTYYKEMLLGDNYKKEEYKDV